MIRKITMYRSHKIGILLFIGIVAGTLIASAQEIGTMAGALQVADAKFGTNVENRMIIGEDSTFAVQTPVFLWMKVTGGTSDQITVTWKLGEVSHATTLNIGGSPWRTWATKTVTTAGDWSVTVTDASGNVLKEMMFTVR